MNFCIDWTSWPILTIVIGTILRWIITDRLIWLNYKLNANSTGEDSYKDVISAHPLIGKFLSYGQYCKSIEYSSANAEFNCISRLVSRLTGSLMLALCAWPCAIAWLQQFAVFNNSMLLTLITATSAISVALTILDIPFDLYHTFKIEEKFGFNTQTLKSWAGDLVKSMCLSLATTAALMPLTYYAIFIFTHQWGIDITSTTFIALMLAGSIAVSFAYEWLYINVLARIFNKFTPLEDKSLEKQIKDMISNAGFSVSGIYVMDAGKRSKHGNAYFCGWGKCKRIVLYDVLLEKHSREEILAILSHEVGHLVHHDMVKNRIQSIVYTAIELLVSVKLASLVSFYHCFGFSMVSAENITEWYLVGFALANLVIGSVTWLLDPVLSFLSREDENAADTYAVSCTSAEAMKSALVKLSADNLSNFNVHPWYEWWFYDHPSLKNRLKNISK